MTPEQITGLGPALAEFLGSFKNCFGECRLRDHFATYCRGLLSSLKRKTIEPIALAAGGTVRALQLFLSQRAWDHQRLCDQLQQRVAARHGPAPGSARTPGDLGVIGLIDETSVAKKGAKTPGVQRQYCGASGKIDNCIVTVHLGYTRQVGAGHWAVLLDADLYLPKVWAEDRARCTAADIPEDMVCRPKPAMALEQVRRALANGVRFDWFVFDEGYGKDPSFLFGLDALGQTWIGEVPSNFRCWPTQPQCHSLRKEFASRQAYNVVRWSPAFIYQEWQTIAIPRQTVEPVTWDVKAAQVHLVHDGRPTDRTYWLIVAWNRATGEHKYFVSNAPPHTDLGLLLRVAFHRAQVEHLFRVAKDEVGLTHFEGQSYVSLMRHMILCQLVLLFLAERAQHINAQRPVATPLPTAMRGEKDTGPAPANITTTPAAAAHAAGNAGRDRPLPQLALYALA